MASDDLEDVPVLELFSRYGAILAKLREHKVVRTNNAPAGDWAEYLICAYLKGSLAGPSEKGWDVLGPDDTHVQVKARVVFDPANRGQRQLSVIRSFDFDLLAIVLFDGSFGIRRGVLLPVKTAKQHSVPTPYVNGRRLMATDDLLGSPTAKDITRGLRRIAAKL